MAKFADYGFNKSHAAAYALIAYQTAWLKANHPEVFLAACMSLAINNTDRLAALKQDAERGIDQDPAAGHQPFQCRFLRRAHWRTDAWRSAMPLAAVKKVGFSAMESVAAARGETPFADLADFAKRVDPRQLNRMQIENLARSGAFDRLDANRARVFAGAETILRRCAGGPGRKGKRADRPVRRRYAASRSRCVCRTSPTGRRWSGWRSRPRPSASISPRIRSTLTLRRCGASASRRRCRSRRGPPPGSAG